MDARNSRLEILKCCNVRFVLFIYAGCRTFSQQHKPCCHDEGRENSLNYISASPFLVIPASLRWPCEPRAWAAGRWDLPLGWANSHRSVLKVAAGCRDVLMTFKDVKSGRWQTTLYLLSALPRESESASLDQKVKRGDLSFSQHLLDQRIEEKKNGLTAPLLGPLSARVTWVHYCWPGWKT